MRRIVIRSIHLSRHSLQPSSTATQIVQTTKVINSITCFSHSEYPESESTREYNKALYSLICRGRLDDAEELFISLRHHTPVTWNSMLYGYVRHGHLTLAQNLFDKMPHKDIVAWNTLLGGYAKSRDVWELRRARELFDEMPRKDVCSWNTMIRGYATNGRMSDALALFKNMPERNAVTYNTMITGLLESGCVREAIEMFESMPVRDPSSLTTVVAGLVRNGMIEDAESVVMDRWKKGEVEGIVAAYNTLIAGYGHLGDIENARRIFDMIPDRVFRDRKQVCSDERACRNVITWNSMMMCYIEAGDVSGAESLFKKIPIRDMISWNTMISGYVRVLDMKKAALLFEKLRSPDHRTWNFMISGYAKSGDVEKAREYFDRMCRRCTVSWNTMIAGYEQNADYAGAIKLFIEMQEVGERPDRHTLSSVLSACAGLASINTGSQFHQLITKTFTPDIPISNSLISMYARCGDLNSARYIFDGVKSSKDFITWNAMIGGYSQHGLVEEALNLFAMMREKRVKPTPITFISVLNACYHGGFVTEGQRIFESMVNGFGIMPSVEHYALLVNFLGRHGKLEEAMKVIDGMLVPPDKSVWGALLDACKVHKNCDLARVAADALMQIDPDSGGPYVLLYNMYMDLGRWEDAMEVREILDKKGIKKQPGYSWIELQGSVHSFVAGDGIHPLAAHIYALIDNYEKISRDEFHLDITSITWEAWAMHNLSNCIT